MKRIVGLDLSLVETGIADASGTFTLKNKLKGMERLEWIRHEVHENVIDADLVVVEGYSFGSPGRAHATGELGGVVRLMMYENKVRYAEVPPATLKKFTTGKGNANKDEMIAAAIRKFGFQGSNNNEADAYMLRLMGLYYFVLDPPDIARTEYMIEAIAKVPWPTGGEA
jgi:crossover junction endodeoxyribonuclease RuvC